MVHNTQKTKNAILLSSVGSNPDGTPGGNTQMVDRINTMMEQTRELAGSGRVDYTALDTNDRQNMKTWIRSPFAEARGLHVEKRYTDLNGGIFQ